MSDLPDDYNPLDGVGEGLIDQCGRCEQSFHPERYDGRVYDQDGQEYEHIMDTDSSDRPFFCPDCWAVLDANQKAEEHQTLAEWSE